MSLPRVNIDALSDVAGIAVINGRDVEVLHVDGETYRTLLAIDAGSADPDDVLKLYDGAARCCPSIPREEIDRLTPTKIGAILSIAQAPVGVIEAQFPNGNGPVASTPNTPAPPASPSMTPSAT